MIMTSHGQLPLPKVVPLIQYLIDHYNLGSMVRDRIGMVWINQVVFVDDGEVNALNVFGSSGRANRYGGEWALSRMRHWEDEGTEEYELMTQAAAAGNWMEAMEHFNAFDNGEQVYVEQLILQ